jgi:hypothetical protein
MNFLLLIEVFTYKKGEETPFVPLRILEVPYLRRKEVNYGYHTFNNLVSTRVEPESWVKGIFIIPKDREYIDGFYVHEANRASSTLIYFGKYNWWNRFRLKRKYGWKCLDGLV